MNSQKKEISQKKLVVFTAISKGYDVLNELPDNFTPYSRIAFLEQKKISSRTWDICPLNNPFKDPCRNAKIYKVLPHLFFPNAEYSLWIDGRISIKFQHTLEFLIETYLRDSDICVFKHNLRDCIYAEALECTRRNLDDKTVIKRQIKKYEQAGYPKNSGLSECSVILRRHTELVRKFNETWWAEISTGSKRDQLSFDYTAKITGLKVSYFPGNLRSPNGLFERGEHRKNFFDWLW